MGKDGDPGGEASAVTQEPKRRDPKMQAAKVHLLDKSQRDYELNRGSNGDVLFQIVTKQLGIEEREYFSLCFYDATGTRHWLYNDKRIIRQLKDLPWEFHFEVKFYPNAPSTMNDEHARYNLFLQMKHDLFTGRLPATIPTQASLASLIAQAEFGDASHSAEYEQYLRTSNIVPNMSDELMNTIKEEQIKHRGLTPLEAETKFLELCKQLSMYGVHLFPAKDSNNQPVSIGICAGGINIYNDLVRIHRLAWQNINKISYKKNTFSVKMKPGEFDEKKEVTLLYKLTDYAHAKRVWKCGVEHHTFFRLIQPEEKQKGGVFRWGSGRFRYHGRTQFQTKMASQMFDTPSSNAVQRSNSARLSQSCDNMHQRTPLSTLQYSEKELGSKEPLTSPAVSYDVSASKRVSSTNGKSKSKKAKGVKEADSSESSSSDDDQRVVTVAPAPQESGQPHMTVASWQEKTLLPDDVTIEYDEHGNKITRTVKTSQVKHTVQKQTFQNYVVGNEPEQGTVFVEKTREEITPLGVNVSSKSPIVETHSRSVAYDNTSHAPGDGYEGLGEFVSSKTVTTGNRTIETITYKTEKDGIVETHVEHRVTIHSTDPIDHDAELSAAIAEATQMNPDMTVEKIEVRQETTA